jgi:hypothetical protein
VGARAAGAAAMTLTHRALVCWAGGGLLPKRMASSTPLFQQGPGPTLPPPWVARRQRNPRIRRRRGAPFSSGNPVHLRPTHPDCSIVSARPCKPATTAAAPRMPTPPGSVV